MGGDSGMNEQHLVELAMLAKTIGAQQQAIEQFQAENARLRGLLVEAQAASDHSCETVAR